MPLPNILIVAVDGLRTSALGAYGNTTFATPALDEFAAQSFLLDHCYAPAPELADVYRALWLSSLPARFATAAGSVPSLARSLVERGYRTILLSDQVGVISFAGAADFERQVELKETPVDTCDTRAVEITDTTLARSFAAASEMINSLSRDEAPSDKDSPIVLWFHTRGMYGPWDAPLKLQQLLLDESDPPPIESALPPDFEVGGRDDPDTVFRHACAYAAQVMVLDACWRGLMEAVQDGDGDEQWLISLLGVRGFPLGEHRRIGGVDARLYGEQLHVPWLLRFPDSRGRSLRSGLLVSPLDLLPTLSDWVQNGRRVKCTTGDGMSVLPLIDSSRVIWRDGLTAINAVGARAFRTAEWCFCQGADDQDGELYVRPDDRWEHNDVAKLCPDEVTTLSDRMNELVQNSLNRQPATVADSTLGGLSTGC